MTQALQHTQVDTVLGWLGLVWGPHGLLRVQLPQASRELTRAQLQARFPDAQEAPLPPALTGVAADLAALLRGERTDLSGAPLDMRQVPAFHAEVYTLARRIPFGETTTYGALATLLGDVSLSRAVGVALGRNPWPLIVPCHRVTAADGSLGGFSAPGGVQTKRRLLALEGAPPARQGELF